MFGGSLQNFSEQQNARTTEPLSSSSLASQGDKSPASPPALDLKCYAPSVSSATSGAEAGQTSITQRVTKSNPGSNSSPPTVISTPSPTERPETPVQPENLSISTSDKDALQSQHHHHHQHSHSYGGSSSSSTGPAAQVPNNSSKQDAMESGGRCTPMPVRDYIPAAHADSASASHPPTPSMLGPSSLYPPFSAVRPGSYYPIEHYFPHPGNPSMAEARHAPLPPPQPIAKTPPPR